MSSTEQERLQQNLSAIVDKLRDANRSLNGRLLLLRGYTPRDVYDVTFSNLDHDACNKLSRQCRESDDQLDEDDLSLVYGEVQYESFQNVLDRGLEGIASVHSPTFYDLGSGVGRAIILAALSCKFGKVCGIELMTGLHGEAQQRVAQYRVLSNICAEHACPIPQPPVSLVEGDIFKKDWSDGNLVFCNCTMFSDGMLDQLGSCAEKLKKGSLFISTTHILRSAVFDLVDTQVFDMSWGTATVYFHRKKPIGKWLGKILGGKTPRATNTNQTNRY
jgi:SAM-dependent methyltransferase